MTEPTPQDARSDESRDISDVGLPHPGDPTGTPEEAVSDEAALDEVFPAEDR